MSSLPTTRRALLQHLTMAAALLPSATLLRAGQPTMPTRRIPATGEALPLLGFGSSAAVVSIPTAGTGPVDGVLTRLLELGGRVVDTSPRSEEIDRSFGQLLQQAGRERLFIAAKLNTANGAEGEAQFRMTQKLFGRRPLDLLQVESLRGLEDHWPRLRAWKDAGDVRYIGVTVSANADHERMEAFMRRERPDFVHVNYSVVEAESEQRLLPLARERGMAVLTNRPFMNGSYFRRVADRPLPAWAAEFDCHSWAQFSLKYILANPIVTCALVETTNPAHLGENFGAAFGRLPNAATRKRMRDLVRTF